MGVTEAKLNDIECLSEKGKGDTVAIPNSFGVLKRRRLRNSVHGKNQRSMKDLASSKCNVSYVS